MSKTLNILNTAYRCTIEEQDDPIVWITHNLKGIGADVDLLLRGNAVNYAVKAQDASGISLGGKAQTHPPALAQDLESLAGKGAKVLVVSDDLRERGIESADLIGGVEQVERSALAGLLDDYARVWHW
jgi:sulfur relay (sulfurtransferase) DsrF/TusC family protein